MNAIELNLELCRALKIDPKDVNEVTLTLRPSEWPTVRVQRILREADGLQTVVETLNLRPQQP